MNASTLVKQLSSNEWDALGADAYKLARYWVRRECVRRGMTPGGDMAADCVAIAYSRYVKWRSRHTPKDSARKIQSLIRASALAAIVQGIRTAKRNPATSLEALKLEIAETSDSGEVSAIVTLLLRVPARLMPLASALAFDHHMPTVTELAERQGCDRKTIRNRLAEIRRQPAVVSLARERGLRTLAELAGDVVAAVN